MEAGQGIWNTQSARADSEFAQVLGAAGDEEITTIIEHCDCDDV